MHYLLKQVKQVNSYKLTAQLQHGNQLMHCLLKQDKQANIYKQMVQLAENAGFILADLKLEFGKLDNQISQANHGGG